MIDLKIKRTGTASMPLPEYQTAGAVGLDLYADIDRHKWIERGDIVRVSTGIAVEIPDGYEGQVRPRSGLGLMGITLISPPGTIDPDYRGTLVVTLVNHGHRAFKLEPRTRVAQLVICPVQRVRLVEVDELSPTERGDQGHGSTGGY